MKVRAVVPFSGHSPDGQRHHHQPGDVFDLPAGVDWLENGLVEKVTVKVTNKPKRVKRGVKVTKQETSG